MPVVPLQIISLHQFTFSDWHAIMAEAHSAVAFSFAITHEGWDVNFDREVLHLVWQSGVRSWKKRIARYQVSFVGFMIRKISFRKISLSKWFYSLLTFLQKKFLIFFRSINFSQYLSHHTYVLIEEIFFRPLLLKQKKEVQFYCHILDWYYAKSFLCIV